MAALRARGAGGMAYLLAALIVAMGVLDVVSTNVSLAAGNTEANALIAALQAELGMWWFIPKMAVHLAVAAALLWLPTRTMLRGARAGVALYAVIVLSNFHVAGWTL